MKQAMNWPTRWGYVAPTGKVVHAHGTAVGYSWPHTACMKIVMETGHLDSGLAHWHLKPCTPCVRAIERRIDELSYWVEGLS